MGRPLDEDDVIKALKVAYWDDGIQSAKNDPCIVDAMTDWAIRQVKALPSAQPEIVRCKNCKYWREHKYARETKRYIPFCGFNAIYTKADDFCSKGTRRTGGAG